MNTYYIFGLAFDETILDILFFANRDQSPFKSCILIAAITAANITIIINSRDVYTYII